MPKLEKIISKKTSTVISIYNFHFEHMQWTNGGRILGSWVTILFWWIQQFKPSSWPSVSWWYLTTSPVTGCFFGRMIGYFVLSLEFRSLVFDRRRRSITIGVHGRMEFFLGSSFPLANALISSENALICASLMMLRLSFSFLSFITFPCFRPHDP